MNRREFIQCTGAAIAVVAFVPCEQVTPIGGGFTVSYARRRAPALRFPECQKRRDEMLEAFRRDIGRAGLRRLAP